MCSSFTPDCGYDNSTINLIGHVFCPNTKCSGKVCLDKKNFKFKSVSRNDYQCQQCASLSQVRKFIFWKSNNFFFLIGWPSCLHSWRESKINSRSYWNCLLSRQVLFQQRERRLSWRLCNNPENQLWLSKVRSLVVSSQSSFYDTRARKDDTTRQNTLFLKYKKQILFADTQSFPIFPLQRTNYRKKELWVDNKVQETIGDVYLPTYRKKSVFTLKPKKKTSRKERKACCSVLNSPFNDQNRQLCCLLVTVHIFLQKKTNWDYKKKS